MEKASGHSNSNKQNKDILSKVNIQKPNNIGAIPDNISLEKKNYQLNNIQTEKKQEVKIQIAECEKSVVSHLDKHFYPDMKSKFILKVFGILITQLFFTFGFVLLCQLKLIKDFLLKQKILLIVLLSEASVGYFVVFIIFMCKLL